MKMITIELPEALLVATLPLLKHASEHLSSAGCNDFILCNTPENRELISTMQTWDCPSETRELHITESGKGIYTSDYEVLGYFRHFVGRQQGADEPALP